MKHLVSIFKVTWKDNTALINIRADKASMENAIYFFRLEHDEDDVIDILSIEYCGDIMVKR